jgi:hypothetical protein
MPMWNAIYAMNKDTKLMYAQRNLKLWVIHDWPLLLLLLEVNLCNYPVK